MTNKQHAFVTEYLRRGDKIIAYCLAYKKESRNYTAIESAANRLLRTPEVAQAIDSVQKAIRAEVEYELKQQLYTELLTVQRKRELLARIATGRMTAVQQHKGKDCRTCEQIVTPTINQMLKAIDLDNKMAGHYTLRTINEQQFTVNNNLHKQVDEFTQQFTVDSPQIATSHPLPADSGINSGETKVAIAQQPGETANSEVDPCRTDNTTKLVPSFREDRRVLCEEEQYPLLFSAGDIGDAPLVQEPIGEVNPRRTDNTPTKGKQEEENHNKTEQIPVAQNNIISPLIPLRGD